MQELREQLQHGLPEPQSEGSSKIYRLLFGLHGSGMASPLQNSQGQADAPVSAAARDTHFGVDGKDLAFGPSKGAKAAPSPYSKDPASDETGAKGKGVGQTTSAPVGAPATPGAGH